MIGSELADFVRSEALKKVPGQFSESFIEDVIEDLDQIDESRIVGLGVTPGQLNEWLGEKQ